MPVKGRGTYYLSFLLIILMLFAGCMSKPLKEPTGPKWDANFTIPFITRNEDNGAQIFLDDTINDLGEEGLGLQGENLTEFKNDFEQFGYFTVEVEELDIPPIPLSGLGSGTLVPVDETTEFEIPVGLSEIRLSDRTTDDDLNPVNTIVIGLDGATAGTGGVTISLTDANEEEYNTTIAEGDTSDKLELTDAVLGGTMVLGVSGEVITGTGDLNITFSPTTLEVAEMTVSAEKLDEMLDFDMEEEEEIEIELGDVGLEFTALEFTFESEEMPAGLQARLDLHVEGRDKDGITVVEESEQLSLVLESEEKSTLDLASAANPILAEDPYYLVFVIEDIGFSTTDDKITIEHENGMDLTVTHSIGLRTKPESEEVEELEEDLIQYARLVMDIDNNSPLGLALRIYLSPNEEDLSNDLKRVEKVVEIAPFMTGQPVVLDITAEELSYLTGTGTLWHQIEVEHTSEDDEIKKGDCLEITSYAEVKVRIDPEKMMEEEE